ncbi:shikimate dehydrogenase, partial [Azotobacter chroococcum]|nr:shikimate dehydrogenase [Azotobacter chroococcum]
MNDALLIPSPTGSTRLYAVVGDPIAQVQAPTLLNRLFAERGIDALMLPVQAGAADFATVIEGLKRIGNLDGLLITVPHKLAVAAHADEQSLTVALTGSSNALRRQANGRWLADNFDGAGFVAGLRHAGHEPEGWRVALFGSGGAGSAIA